MDKKRAQTTTEYMILLAVTIIILGILAGFFGLFSDLGASQSAKPTLIQYAQLNPLSITSWTTNETHTFIVFKNKQDSDIYLHNLTLEGIDFETTLSTNATIRPRLDYVATIAQPFEIDLSTISFTYTDVQMQTTHTYDGNSATD